MRCLKDWKGVIFQEITDVIDCPQADEDVFVDFEGVACFQKEL